jgi:hypothetical protein
MSGRASSTRHCSTGSLNGVAHPMEQARERFRGTALLSLSTTRVGRSARTISWSSSLEIGFVGGAVRTQMAGRLKAQQRRWACGLQIQRHLRTLNPINFRTIVPMIADSWR